MSTLRWRPSPALLVAALAISIALVGTAAAGPIDNPIAQDSRLTKKDRRIAAKTARKIAVRLIKRFSPRFANRQITRRAPNLSVGNAAGVNDGAISTDKLSDDAVTGEKIDESSTPFGRIVHKARGDNPLAVTGAPQQFSFDDASYTQEAEALNQFAGALDVTFQNTCTQPRNVSVYLQIDAPNPAVISPPNLLGFGTYSDATAGTTDARVEIGPFAGLGTAQKFAPGTDTQHTLSMIVSGNCSVGAGIVANFGGVDVVGIK